MQDGRHPTLAAVSLPPLPVRTGGAARPGGVSRVGRGVAGVHRTPPTPPPRPESSLQQPPPPRPDHAETVPVSPLSSPLSHLSLDTPPHISLTQPRPGGQRLQNLYVDTPFKGGVTQLPRPGSVKRLVTGRQPVGKCQSLSTAPLTHSNVILKQPAVNNNPVLSGGCNSLKQPQPSVAVSTTVDNVVSAATATDSIICTSCGKCRCTACRTPRQLPQAWLCNNACLCSVEAFVDTVTCMCCVKGVFYHCGKDGGEEGEEASCVDKPCSCTDNKRCLRWGCLSLMSLPLPCLLCYLPMKGVCRGVEVIYQRCTSQGCRCPTKHNSSHSQTDSQKRLLG